MKKQVKKPVKKSVVKPSDMPTITPITFVEDLLNKFQMEIEAYADIRNEFTALANRINPIDECKSASRDINEGKDLVNQLDDKIITLAHLNISMRYVLGQLKNSI
jgi:uncharacterized protein YydD (DUF2326 family)